MKEFIFPVSEEDYGEDYKWIEEHNNGELVRCKDCAHGSLWCGNIKCVKPGMKKYEMDLHPVNWFCADGKRRSDND